MIMIHDAIIVVALYVKHCLAGMWNIAYRM
jgi:hypothetical protein